MSLSSDEEEIRAYLVRRKLPDMWVCYEVWACVVCRQWALVCMCGLLELISATHTHSLHLLNLPVTPALLRFICLVITVYT